MSGFVGYLLNQPKRLGEQEIEQFVKVQESTIRHWLKNELFDWARTIIEDSRTDHLMDKTYVLNLLESHQSGTLDYSREIWAVLMFMIWCEMAFDMTIQPESTVLIRN